MKLTSSTFVTASIVAAASALCCLATARAQTGTDLLQNGGFEYQTSTYTAGNNTVTPSGWTLVSGGANVQQGAATGTNAGTNLNPYNGAYSGGTNTTQFNSNTDTGGTHFFDGTNDVNNFSVISQSFTLTQTTTLSGSFELGARDGATAAGLFTAAIAAGAGQSGTSSGTTNNTTTSYIQILTGTGTGGAAVPINFGAASVTTYYGDTSKIAVGNWELNPFTANNLAAGTYTLQVHTYASQNFDSIALAAVPEPSTWALLGVSTAVGGLALRRRRARFA